MIPQAILYKPTGPDCEASHDLVVVRIRAGKHEHIGGQTYDDKTGEPVPLKPSGKVTKDDVLGGFWLVGEKYVREFDAAWKLEQARRKAEAAAKKGG